MNYEIDQSIQTEVYDEFKPPTIISREAVIEKQHERNRQRLNLFKVRLSKVAEYKLLSAGKFVRNEDE